MIKKTTLFLFILLSCSLPVSVSAVQFAITIPEQTIIYSDMDLKSPIGYLKADTVIKVGEVSRRGNTILPSIISGKIVYIRMHDIRILSYERAKDLIEYQKMLKRVDESRDILSLGLQYIEVGNNWLDLQSLEGLEQKAIYGTQWKLRYQHYNDIVTGRLNWRLGLNSQQNSNQSLYFRNYSIAGGLSYYLFHDKNHFLNAVGELGYSPYNYLKMGSEESWGHSYSLDFSLEYSINILYGLFLQISGGYNYQKLLSFDVTPRVNPSYMSFNGYNAYLGIGYQFDFYNASPFNDSQKILRNEP